jgi:hypothetical protein
MATSGTVTALAPATFNGLYELFDIPQLDVTELRASEGTFRRRPLVFWDVQAAVDADNLSRVLVANAKLRFEITADSPSPGTRGVEVRRSSITGISAVEAASWSTGSGTGLSEPPMFSGGDLAGAAVYELSGAGLNAIVQYMIRNGPSALLLQLEDDSTGEVGFKVIDPASWELDFDWVEEPDSPTPGTEYSSRFMVTEDCTINASSANAVNGGGQTVIINGSSGQVRAALERIDLTDPIFGDRQIPEGAEVVSVTMHKYCTSVGTTGQTHLVRKVLTEFDCEELDEVFGIYGCSHNHRTMEFDGEEAMVGVLPWNTAGAQGVGSDIAADEPGNGFSWPNPSSTGAFTVSNAEMAATFQAALGTTLSLKHWRTGGATTGQYASRNNSEADRRPYYTVVWKVPVTPGGGGAGSGSRRDLRGRRRIVL